MSTSDIIKQAIVKGYLDYSNGLIEEFNNNPDNKEMLNRYWNGPRPPVTEADLTEALDDGLPAMGSVPSELGAISYVENRGGEGDGAPVYYVVKVGDKYYEIETVYSSWDYTDWNDEDFYEVVPEKVTVVKYRRA